MLVPIKLCAEDLPFAFAAVDPVFEHGNVIQGNFSGLSGRLEQRQTTPL